MNRFISDKVGTYDLAAVSSVTAGGVSTPTRDLNVTVRYAIAHLEGGQSVNTETPYDEFVKAWTAYHTSEEPAAHAGV
jgi:hypothetical protein